MRLLSFRIIYFFILLPPVLYVFSIQGLEVLLQRTWTAELGRTLISDTDALLQGTISVEEEVQRNVQRFLAARSSVRWGARVQVLVATGTGRILYPRFSLTGADGPGAGDRPLPGPALDPALALQVAAANAKTLEQGMVLSLGVEIPHNTWVANSVLVFYLLIFSGILARIYIARVREAERLEAENRRALEAATMDLGTAQERLHDLTLKEEDYKARLERSQAELASAKVRVTASEEEALAELEVLEEKLRESAALRQEAEEEVKRLREERDRLERPAGPTQRKRQKQAEVQGRRFTTLYKNLRFGDRALEGFLDLRDEMQLKAEEMIHTLNHDPALVPVRRKVFSGKGASTVLESEFAHRGRLYWRRAADGRVDILAVGTKNSQERDLAYLRKTEAP